MNSLSESLPGRIRYSLLCSHHATLRERVMRAKRCWVWGHVGDRVMSSVGGWVGPCGAPWLHCLTHGNNEARLSPLPDRYQASCVRESG